MAKPIKQPIAISNKGAQKRFWRALFHDEDKERDSYNCSDPCKTGRNLEPKAAQRVLLQQRQCFHFPEHVLLCLGKESTWQQSAESTEHVVSHPNTAKGRM